MNFINAGILVALAAAAAPILIHIFSRQRFKEIDFSTLKFLKRLERRRMRNLKLTQWLLLLLRTLAVVMIVIAFARPALLKTPGASSGEAQTAAVMILDNSIASQAMGPSGAVISEVRTRAAEALSIFTDDDRVTLMAAAEPVETTFDEPLPGKDERLRRWIFEIETSDAAPDFREALKTAAEILNRAEQPNKEIYLVSPLYGGAAFIDSAVSSLPPEVRVFLLETGPEALGNVTIASVDIETRIFQAGGPVSISVKVVNHSAVPRIGIPLSLFVGEERMASTALDIPADGEAEVRLKFIPDEGGFVSGQVKLDLEDALSTDNKRFFAFFVPERVRVFLIGDSLEVSLVELALKPSANIEYSVQPIRLKSPEELTAYPEAGVIFLLGVDKVNSYVAGLISRMLERGGGVLLSPSIRTNPAAINRELLKPLNAPQYGEMLFEPEGITWGSVDQAHLLFEGVLEDTSAVESPLFFRRFKIFGAGGDVISFRRGDPYLREAGAGKGSILVFSSGFSSEWSDIYHRGIFVPLMHRAAVYLGSRNSADAEFLTAGEMIEHYAEPSEYGYRLEIPRGSLVEMLPDRQSSLMRFRYRDTGASGVYRLLRGEEQTACFAVNPALEASRLQRLRAAALPGENVITSGMSIENTVRLRRVGRELWRWAMLLTVGFLAAETVIGRLAK